MGKGTTRNVLENLLSILPGRCVPVQKTATTIEDKSELLTELAKHIELFDDFSCPVETRNIRDLEKVLRRIEQCGDVFADKGRRIRAYLGDFYFISITPSTERREMRLVILELLSSLQAQLMDM